MNSEKILAEKQAARQAAIARRTALSDAARGHASVIIRHTVLELPVVAAARTVFCFISHGEEVETHGLIDALWNSGKTVLAPRLRGRAEMLAVRFDGWDHVAPGQLGILVPEQQAEFAENTDVVLAPGLAFTPDGDRLGWGRGYYDRWFSRHQVALRIAVGFDCQIVDRLPVTPQDVPVDMIVTEQRTIRVPGAHAGS
jgi:5-formyltetrahydrofolate cyclo-ligase